MSVGFWKQSYRLDEMSLRSLWLAYLTHYTIVSYLVCAVASLGYAVHLATTPMQLLLPAIAAIIIYPLVWYALHRWVLHGAWLYRLPAFAKMWKRIHFDHHRDPHDLNVLFGALSSTLPTIALATMPIGWWLGGTAGLWAAFATGLLTTCFYEFNHCIQHLNYTPRWNFIKRMKRLHLQHHFYDEKTNYGITNFAADKFFRSYAANAKGRSRSATVFNLGYTGEQVRLYPWVARLTPDIDYDRAVAEGIDRRAPSSASRRA